MTKIIEGDLVLKENTTFDEDLIVRGNIRCEGGCWNLDCWNLDCWNLNCWNLNCCDLNCCDLNCRNLNCWDLNFYAFCIAYNSFKCKSWKARRDKFVCKCLDGEIEIINKSKCCEKCRQEIK
jgi:hypothetical protein